MKDSRSSYRPWQKQKRRLYISIGGNYLRDLRMIGYRVEMLYMTSWPGAFEDHLSTSCSYIRHRLEYGTELSWLDEVCADSTRSRFLPLDQSDNICGGVSHYAEKPLGKNILELFFFFLFSSHDLLRNLKCLSFETQSCIKYVNTTLNR